MNELFAAVLDYQNEYSSENTPAMEARGLLIRQDIPAEMRTWEAARTGAAEPFKGRLNVQGRDGTGRKTFIPWVRIHSPELSPSAQNGWYVVYLFEPDGEGVHLCLSHGSTRFDGRQFKQRSAAEIQPMMDWSRALIGPIAGSAGFNAGLDLHSQMGLARPYEASTAFSKRYERHALPADVELRKDALAAVGLLGLIYREIETGRAPDSDPPDIAAAEGMLSDISQPLATRRTGQGYGLSPKERKIVELHAMSRAKDWLSDHGYSKIKDISSKRPADFEAVKDGQVHVIEVKGTTAGRDSIMLTHTEVALHRNMHPANVLIVVSEIELLDMRTKAFGGVVSVSEAWKIDETELRAIAYRCRLNW